MGRNFNIIIKFLSLNVIALLFYSFNLYSQSPDKDHTELKWNFTLAANSFFYPLATLGTGATLITIDGIGSAGGNLESNSYSISVIPKYFFKKNLGLRIEFGISKLKNDAHVSTPTTTTTPITYNINGLNSTDQKTLKYCLGIERKDIISKRMELFSGISLALFNCSDIKAKYNIERRDKSTDTLLYSESTVRTTEGGSAVGLSPFLGLEYYPLRHISVGLEFSAFYLYYNVGGNHVETQVSQIGQQAATTTETISKISYRGFRLEKPIASISISIHF